MTVSHKYFLSQGTASIKKYRSLRPAVFEFTLDTMILLFYILNVSSAFQQKFVEIKIVLTLLKFPVSK